MSEPTSMAEILANKQSDTVEVAEAAPKKLKKNSDFGPNYFVAIEGGRFVNTNGDYIGTNSDGLYAPKSQEEQDQLDYHYGNGLLIKV